MRKSWLCILLGISLLSLAAVPAVAQDEESGDEEQQVVDVSGDWVMTWQGRTGPQKGVLSFEQNGDELSGSFTSTQGRKLELKGMLLDSNISFRLLFPPPREGSSLEYSGTVEGDQMKGTAELPTHSVEWSAERK
jgi:hypothetical protein